MLFFVFFYEKNNFFSHRLSPIHFYFTAHFFVSLWLEHKNILWYGMLLYCVEAWLYRLDYRKLILIMKCRKRMDNAIATEAIHEQHTIKWSEEKEKIVGRQAPSDMMIWREYEKQEKETFCRWKNTWTYNTILFSVHIQCFHRLQMIDVNFCLVRICRWFSCGIALLHWDGSFCLIGLRHFPDANNHNNWQIAQPINKNGMFQLKSLNHLSAPVQAKPIPK